LYHKGEFRKGVNNCMQNEPEFSGFDKRMTMVLAASVKPQGIEGRFHRPRPN
jgi:hypothetical protein